MQSARFQRSNLNLIPFSIFISNADGGMENICLISRYHKIRRIVTSEEEKIRIQDYFKLGKWPEKILLKAAVKYTIFSQE